MPRILAVDPGEKRVGLALSDPLQLIASPYQVIPNPGAKKLAKELLALAAEKDVELAVIGYPEGAGEQAPACLLAEKLQRSLEAQGLKVVLWDEHYTSSGAADILRKGGVKSKGMKGKLDKIAASLLLEDFLSSR